MKPMYFDKASRAIADLVELAPGYYLITRINVPVVSRRRGLGTKILNEILRDADTEGATLEIHPMSSGGPTRNQLISWYESHGFSMGQSFSTEEPVRVLIREPGGR